MGCIQDKTGGRTGELVKGRLGCRLHGRVCKSGQRLGSGRIWGLVWAGIPAQQF